MSYKPGERVHQKTLPDQSDATLLMPFKHRNGTFITDLLNGHCYVQFDDTGDLECEQLATLYPGDYLPLFPEK